MSKQPTELTTKAESPASFNKRLSAYQHPSRARSIWQLCNTLIPCAALWGASWWALQYSFWLALPLVILLSGFTVRTFILFHDCGHQAFFRSRKANTFWGRLTGVLTFTPYYYWHASHARHHSSSGNLDARGFGDIWLMTVDEYLESTKGMRLRYRLYRHPLVFLFLGPLYIAFVNHRVARAESNAREKHSVWLTNLAIVIFAALLSWLLGWKSYLTIQIGTLFLAHISGVWLFYVQHQFEGVYWERDGKWDFVTASLAGSSFYKLPRILAWFTGNIGYHHVHHLNSRIPNYNLPKCHRDSPTLQKIRPIRFFSSLSSLRFRLWDEQRRMMVGFRGLKANRTTPSE